MICSMIERCVLDNPAPEHRHLNMMEVARDMMKRTNYKLVPQIFIKGHFIGGRSELEKLHNSGQLRKMI